MSMPRVVAIGASPRFPKDMDEMHEDIYQSLHAYNYELALQGGKLQTHIDNYNTAIANLTGELACLRAGMSEQGLQQQRFLSDGVCQEFPVMPDRVAQLEKVVEVLSKRIDLIENSAGSRVQLATSHNQTVETSGLTFASEELQNHPGSANVGTITNLEISDTTRAVDREASKSIVEVGLETSAELDERHHSAGYIASDLQPEEALGPLRQSGSGQEQQVELPPRGCSVSSLPRAAMPNLFLETDQECLYARLPPCIYSTPLLIKWCLYGRTADHFFGNTAAHFLGNRSVTSVLAFQWLALFSHYTVSLGFLYYINNIASDVAISWSSKSIDCSRPPTDDFLRILAFLLFYLCCGRECLETRNMMLWIVHMKAEKIRCPRLVAETLPTGEKVWVTGLTRRQKQTFIVLIALPKLAIFLVFGFVGTRFLHYSNSNGELMLNCLAMFFVMDVDNFFYDVFTPECIQSALENLPAVAIAGESWYAHYELFGRPWIWYGSMSVLIIMPIFMFESTLCKYDLWS